VKKVLICAAAISSIAGVAHADELMDLKAQSEQLQQQNQMLIQRIGQLEQRQQKIEAQQAAQPAAQPAVDSGPKFPADDGSLTWKGITLYGGVDLGVAYQNAGTPLNGDYGPGLEYLISKNSNKSLVSFAPNALSYTNLGLKGTEEILPGLSGIFNLQTTFVPTSGALSDGTKSLAENNGVALNKQTSNGDSSRAGQPFNGAAYIGLSSPTWGTMTFGRQNSLALDGVIAYDPMGASNAFSLIGYSGTTAGMGDTEDSRLDSTLKYRVNLGPIRASALYQMNGFGVADERSAYEFGLGTDYQGFSFDAVYSQVYDAISASALSAAQFLVEPTNSLAATVSDNTTWMLLARYNWGQANFFAGTEHIQFDNPEHPLPNDTSGLGGYLLSVVNDSAFTQQKVLQISWGGAKYSVTPQLDLIGAYYHESQNSFATGKLSGCSSAALSASCSGDEDAVSLVADYSFTKRFDVYGGAMYSQVSGGLANGFLHDSTIDPTIGARFRF
jgi:predicted porin